MIYKVNSVKDFTDMLAIYITTNKKTPYIDDEVVREFLLKRSEYLTSSLYRYLIRKLLFWRREVEYSGELKAPDRTVAYLGSEDEKNENINKAVQILLKDKPANIQNFRCTETLVPLDFGNGSEFSAVFFDIVKSLPDNEIKRYYYCFVHYKWRKIYKFALIYSIVFWILNIIAYLFSGYFYDNKLLGISASILNVLFMAFEIKCAAADIRRYLSSAWNWLDLFIHMFSIFTVYILIFSNEIVSSSAIAWIRCINVLALSIRGITMLRVFKPTRYLITMLLQVFSDIIPFMVVLAYVVFIFSYVWRIVYAFGKEEVQEDSFYSAFQVPVNAIFG